MKTPVITFFNNKGGVGKTSLVFHLSHMLSQMGERVVAIDLDPQANLTAAFLNDDQLESLWEPLPTQQPQTVYQAIKPLTEVGDIAEPQAVKINERLWLVPGDLNLSGFEDFLSQEWPNSLGSQNLFRPFRVLTAFWQIAQMVATTYDADVILADVGPNLGAINRSSLIGSDYVVIPLVDDLFSLQGLQNLGPSLRAWRLDWIKRLANWSQPSFDLPAGTMAPIGYVVHKHTIRLDRPFKAYDRWLNRIPKVYRESVLTEVLSIPMTPGQDPYCLATLKHYRSLIPMGQEVHKPIFDLASADGAIGSHSYAVQDAYKDFNALAKQIRLRIRLIEHVGSSLVAKVGTVSVN